MGRQAGNRDVVRHGHGLAVNRDCDEFRNFCHALIIGRGGQGRKGHVRTADRRGLMTSRGPQTYNIHEAKTQLSRLVEQAAKGEPFVIAKTGKPMVKVVALDAPKPTKKP